MSGYLEVFGGSPVQASDVSYIRIAAGETVTLQWPTVNVTTSQPVTMILEIETTDFVSDVFMPAGNEASVGSSTLIRNIGAMPLQLRTSLADPIAFISPGESWYIYLTDNSSINGSWGALQFGVGTSSADAAALAGYGLIAIANTLNSNMPTVSISMDYSVVLSDRAKMFVWTSGVGVFSLPAVGSVGNGFFFMLSNLGTGAVTITPDGAETIDGQSTLVINPGESTFVLAASSGWYSLGRGRSTNFNFNQLNKNVAGGSNVTLTTLEASNNIIRFFGALTASIAVIFPNAVNIYIIYNNTSGPYGLTVRTASGTGLSIPQGQRVFVYCDGSDILDADTVIPSISLQFSDGSAAAPSIAFSSSPSDGLYHPSVGNVSVSTAGTQRLEITANGVNTVNTPLLENGIDVMVLSLIL